MRTLLKIAKVLAAIVIITAIGIVGITVIATLGAVVGGLVTGVFTL